MTPPAPSDETKTIEDRYQRMKEKVLTELKNVFRPEFLNRIDSTVVFRPLSAEDIRKVVDNFLPHDEYLRRYCAAPPLPMAGKAM